MLNLTSFKKENQSHLLFTLLCCLVYFISYMTRINYGAAISEIVNSLQISNQLAGMAVIGSFITYGIGQPIFGIIGDRFNPRNIIFLGLLATAICNLIVASISDIYFIIAIWSLNGFFQAMLWPPLVRIIAMTLSNEKYRKTMVWVSAAAAIGTIAVYVLVPVSIWVLGWRLAFVIPALIAITTGFIWLFKIDDYAGNAFERSDLSSNEATYKATPKKDKVKTSTLLITSGLLPILLVIILQGALRDGITTWMPTYINDVYQLGTSVSIFSTAILPIFTIFSVAIATGIQRRLRNEVKAAAYIWIVSLLPIIILIGIYASNVVISIALMAIITGCIHGINLLLVSHIPLHFGKYGRISTISGILNAFTYIGSAISVYGISSLSDYFGWRFTITSWGAIALLGAIICLLSIKKWRRFTVEAAKGSWE